MLNSGDLGGDKNQRFCSHGTHQLEKGKGNYILISSTDRKPHSPMTMPRHLTWKECDLG